MKSLKASIRNGIRYFNYHILWRLIFKLNSAFKTDEKLVVFADTFSNELTDNMKCVYDTLLEKGGYKFIFCLAPEKTGNRRFDLFNEYHGYCRFSKFYARCGTLILTDSYLPAYANKPRKGTKVIQLWHACGAFKKWGYSTLNSGWGASEESVKKYPLHNCYTYVPVSSERVIPYYAEAFNCDKNIILPIGVPRTDIYFNNEIVNTARSKVLKIYPQISDRKIILYAPTFRGVNIKTAHSDNMLDFDLLKSNLNKDYVILNKLHPFVAKDFEIESKYSDFIFNAPSDLEIETALCTADIVITDYSSLIFEYALLERPMIFFAYDLENYEQERSFYLNYKGFVPGEIVSDTNGIIDAVHNIEESFDVDLIKLFKEKYMDACDGSSTKRIIELIEK